MEDTSKKLNPRKQIVLWSLSILFILQFVILGYVRHNFTLPNRIFYVAIVLFLTLLQIIRIWVKWEKDHKILFAVYILASASWCLIAFGSLMFPFSFLAVVLYVLMFVMEFTNIDLFLFSKEYREKLKNDDRTEEQSEDEEDTEDSRTRRMRKLMPRKLPRGMKNKKIVDIYQPIFGIPFLAIPKFWIKIYLVTEKKSYRVYKVNFNIFSRSFFVGGFTLPDLDDRFSKYLLQFCNLAYFTVSPCQDDYNRPLSFYVSNDDRFDIIDTFDNFIADACKANDLKRVMQHSEMEHGFLRSFFHQEKKQKK